MNIQDNISETVRRALAEDVGPGDLTAALIPADARAEAQVITREDAVLCGTAWFYEVFRQVDKRIRVVWLIKDGDAIRAGQMLCNASGPARGRLTGERAAPNFLHLLSAPTPRTRQYVDAV